MPLITATDLREIAWSSASVRFPAPGISRSMTNLGIVYFPSRRDVSKQRHVATMRIFAAIRWDLLTSGPRLLPSSYGTHRAMVKLGIQTPKGTRIGIHCLRHGA